MPVGGFLINYGSEDPASCFTNNLEPGTWNLEFGTRNCNISLIPVIYL